MTNATPGNPNSIGEAGGSGLKQIARLAVLQQEHLYNSLDDAGKTALVQALAKENYGRVPERFTEAKIPRLKRLGEDMQARFDNSKSTNSKARNKASDRDKDAEKVNDLKLESLAQTIAPRNFVLHGLARSLDSGDPPPDLAKKRVKALTNSYREDAYGSKEDWDKFQDSKT